MKKIVWMLLICSAATQSFAAVKRIGYWGTPVAGLDYATPALAVAACAAGDTIYVYGNNAGSPWTIDLTKQLVIIGTGYFYAANTPSNTYFNASLQNYTPNSSAYITLSDGSGSSIITGIVGRVGCNQSHVAAINNIRISNCYVNTYTTMYKNGMTYDGWEISKCYINGTIGYPYTGTAKVTNFKFFNNILYNGDLSFTAQPGQSGIIENCTFYYASSITSNGTPLLIQNCIFTYSSSISGYSNAVFNNCVFDNTPSPGIVGANNILNATLNNIYVGHPTQGTYSDDGRLALKANSPAIGVGIGGIDCGAFGGVNPYKLSGIPAAPAFYKLTAPGTSANTNPYVITFSVKANN